MRASEIYALHIEEERYHQAHEYLESARRALPPGSPARASLDAIAAEVTGEWRAVREALVRLHQFGDDSSDGAHTVCIVSPAAPPLSPGPPDALSPPATITAPPAASAMM